MPEYGLVESKVKAYMEALSPTARALLVKAMHAAEARGETDIPASVVMAAMRGLPLAETVAAAAAAPAPDPRPWAERLESELVAPLAPFLCDVEPMVKQPGRIARGSVPAVLTWIRRDLLAREIGEAMAQDRRGDADAAAQAAELRKSICAAILNQLRIAEQDPKGWQKLTYHLGGEGPARDLRDILYVLQRDTDFLALTQHLPRSCTPHDAHEASPLAQAVRHAVEQTQLAPAFVGVLVLPRTQTPWLLAGLATRLAGTVDPRGVHGSRYAPLVDVVLSEIERQVVLARRRITERPERAKAPQTLRDFHEIVRHLNMALEIELIGPWFKRLGAARREMSDLIAREIENAAGLVRRALRVESLAGDFGGGFDADTCADAEFAVRLLCDARLIADSLALNDLLARTRRQVEQTIEVVAGKLLGDLRTNQTIDRTSLIGAVDGAVRLSAIMFGEDYAAIMRKNRDLALQKPATRYTG